MRRQFSLIPKILRSSNQTFSKVILPKTVYCHPCGEGIFRICQPLGKPQTVFGKVILHGKDTFRGVGKNLFSMQIIFSTGQNIGGRFFGISCMIIISGMRSTESA
jgi:hypothetical protein